MLYNGRKEKKKRTKNIAPLDDGASVHCSMANSVQALEKLTADKRVKADAHTVLFHPSA